MSTDDPFSFLPAEQPKPAKKTHWKTKLFSKDKSKAAAQQHQEIADFLSSRAPDSAPAPPPIDPPRYPPPQNAAPHRIPPSQDTGFSSPPKPAPVPVPAPAPSRQQYTAFNFADPSAPVPAPAPAPASAPAPAAAAAAAKPCARKGKGLQVGFSSRKPEVIGEGGDETESPTIEISRARARTLSKGAQSDNVSGSFADPPRSHLPDLRLDTSLGDGDAQTRQTNLSPLRDGTDWKPPLMQSTQDGDFLKTLSPSGSRISFRGDGEAGSFAQRVRDKMEAEEGRALHHRYDEDIPSPGAEDEDLPTPPSPPSPEPPLKPYNDFESAHDTTSAPAMSHELPVSLSMRSIVESIRNPDSSATSHAPADLSPIDPQTPTSLVPGSPGKVSPTPAKPSPQNLPAPKSVSPPTQGREPARSPQPPKFSLRNVANQVSETSFAEFKEYNAQYQSHIRHAAESVKPLNETSLAEWIRAAVWWFLRGKTRLEAYARSRSTSPSTHVTQAVIDLGKALWVNENIVPGHPELSRHGSMSVDALLATLSMTGDKELVDLLSIYQTLMNHLKSLSMSIKRNNILSAVVAEKCSPAQLDTSIWLRYPFYAPDVSAVLSGAATRSMLVDNAGKLPSLVHMMPLADTSRYFTYGSMFVQVCVSSSDDDGQQQYAMPCALTILRERADWYVFAAITSQSQLVNILIQSDRKQGPTWEDVDWQVRSHSMRVKLPRGFELDVMFKEDDFKTLWNIVKYTQKSENSLHPEAGETVVFENTLKVFQYMDPGTPKAFPSDPTERARIRLFERSVTVTEGTGTRNAHRGFRLAILTSPKVKTLSSIRHTLANGSPIVFGLLRGEDGAPALLLKVTEDGRTRSMLMTFHTAEERTKMHSVLLGMTPREGQMKSPEYAIQSYCIEQPEDSFTGQPPVKYLQFPAGSVSVIDEDDPYVEHAYGRTILSEHLRAFVATEWGSVTDRINLGEIHLADFYLVF